MSTSTPLPPKQLEKAIHQHLQAFATNIDATESLDEIRQDYLVSLLLEPLQTYARKSASSSASLDKLTRECQRELVDSLSGSLEEELDAHFSNEKEAKVALTRFVSEAMDIACGKQSIQTVPAAAPISAAAVVSGQAKPATHAPTSTPSPAPSTTSAPSSTSPSSSLPMDPLVLVLCEIFPNVPPVQIEAIFMACGQELDTAGEILAQYHCTENESNLANGKNRSDSDMDALPAIMQALNVDERKVYKEHLNACKLRQARDYKTLAALRSQSGDSSSISSDKGQFFYDKPEPSLKRQNSAPSSTSAASSSSTSSSSASSSSSAASEAYRDPYYSSEEFLAIKKQLIDKYTYDMTKENTVHKPHIKFESRPKKHARYLDNQIVNTKGEKFTFIVDPAEAAREAEWKATHKPLHIIRTKKKGGTGEKFV